MVTIFSIARTNYFQPPIVILSLSDLLNSFFLFSVLHTTSIPNRLVHENLPRYLWFSQMSPIQGYCLLCSTIRLLWVSAVRLRSCVRKISLGLRPSGFFRPNLSTLVPMFSPRLHLLILTASRRFLFYRWSLPAKFLLQKLVRPVTDREELPLLFLHALLRLQGSNCSSA